jgi:hypothetical protein
VQLSDWRGRSPHKDSLGPKVLAVIAPVLTTLGSDPDPECWIVWGDDPTTRYLVLVPTAAGILEVHVRVNVPGEGPRAGGKVVRWSRVQLGELAVEIVGGHRLVTFQVEGQVLRGSDEDADAVAAFALQLFAAVDGRPPPARPAAARPAAARTASQRTASPAAASTARPAKGR